MRSPWTKNRVWITSQNKGVFSGGCGHDGNMTFVLGAAKIVSQQRHAVKGEYKVYFSTFRGVKQVEQQKSSGLVD